jgi:hypothetical protein
MNRGQSWLAAGFATCRPEEPCATSASTVLWEPGQGQPAPATRPAYPRAARSPEPPARGRAHLLSSDGLGDDEREVMIALDLVWGAVPERGVQPSPVVELLDVLEDRAAGLLVSDERAPAQPLLLQ